nr:MAG TPA: hypothetical protein [Caudoviricetes sp.]
MKARFFIGLLIGVVLGALIACGVYFLTVGDVAWQEYIEEKLAPNIVVALSSIGTILLAATPIISKVSSAVEKFKKATKDVNDTVENNGKNESRIARLEERLGAIETSAKNTEKIVRLGFCNTNELVAKGYANEIAKVGGENEGQDEEKVELEG